MNRTLPWFTIKQHKTEFVGIALVALGIAALALFEALRLAGVHVPPDCLRSSPGPGVAPGDGVLDAAAQLCNQQATSFYLIQNSLQMQLARQLLLFAPMGLAVLVGAPMVATEIERGTAPASWVYDSSRRAWLISKVVAGLLVLLPLLLVVGVAADILEANLVPTLDPFRSFDGYLDRGVITMFWALAGFTGAVALSAITGRTIQAVMIGLLLSLLIRSAWPTIAATVVLRPFAVAQEARPLPVSFFSVEADLPIYTRYYLHDEPFDGDVAAWYAEHLPPATPGPAQTPPPGSGPSGAEVDGPRLVHFVIPAANYWNVILLNALLFSLASAVAIVVAFAATARRRPY